MNTEFVIVISLLVGLFLIALSFAAYYSPKARNEVLGIFLVGSLDVATTLLFIVWTTQGSHAHHADIQLARQLAIVFTAVPASINVIALLLIVGRELFQDRGFAHVSSLLLLT